MITATKIMVRYAETDQMGIAHHSVYPIWYEVARTEYIKQFDFSYSEMEQAGVMMPLINLTCHYGLPAKYEDEIRIEASIKKLSNAKVLFYYHAVKECDGTPIGYGTTEHGFVDAKTFRPISIKRYLPDLYQKLSQAVEP